MHKVTKLQVKLKNCCMPQVAGRQRTTTDNSGNNSKIGSKKAAN